MVSVAAFAVGLEAVEAALEAGAVAVLGIEVGLAEDEAVSDTSPVVLEPPRARHLHRAGPEVAVGLAAEALAAAVRTDMVGDLMNEDRAVVTWSRYDHETGVLETASEKVGIGATTFHGSVSTRATTTATRGDDAIDRRTPAKAPARHVYTPTLRVLLPSRVSRLRSCPVMLPTVVHQRQG